LPISFKHSEKKSTWNEAGFRLASDLLQAFLSLGAWSQQRAAGRIILRRWFVAEALHSALFVFWFSYD